MNLVTKALLTYGLLLALAVLGSALAVVAVKESQVQTQRTALANDSYHAYLRLSNHTYQLFKQFADAMLIGDQDQFAGEAKLIAALKDDIVLIRQIVAKEIELVGANQANQLRLLGEIELQIQNLITEYQQVIDNYDPKNPAASWRTLTTVLDEQVDGDFNELIERALAEELRDVEAARAATDELRRQFVYRILGLASISLLAGFAALVLLVKDIKLPVEALAKAADEIAAGHFGHRVPTDYAGELKRVAEALNAAAAAACAREESLLQARNRLEEEVTERTAELQRTLDLLGREIAMRRQLIADVSHELRTPLTIIRGEAGVALRGGAKSTAEYREALRKTKEAAEHTAGLVDDLLFVARQESGEDRLQLGAGDIVSLIKDNVERVRTLYADHGFAVRIDLFADAAPALFDQRRLSQALLVLLENARSYGRSPIDVALAPVDDGIEISVTDHGNGIASAEAEEIFDRFYRGSNAAERYGGGSGLGLPVARAIVEAHGGTLTVDGRPGQGARFSIFLPERVPLRGAA